VEEQKKLAATEVSMWSRLQAQFAAEYEKQRLASEKKMQTENNKVIAKIAAERDDSNKKLKEANARESEMRKQALEEATKTAAKQLEKQNETLQKMTTERDTAVRKIKEAEAREAEIRKQAKDEAEKGSLKELKKQREALEKDHDSIILKKQAEFNRERDGWQKKLKEMERKVQKNTANQLGDGAELDLYETLREAFTDDRVTRVPRGQNGADVHHEVRYKGQRCGLIMIDSKNRQSWQNAYISKLRADQMAAKAEHAILSSSVFPSGEKEMCMQSDVIVVSPARVVYLVQLLRRSIISTHVLGLSMEERNNKTDQLYKLITSEAYIRRFDEVVKLNEEVLQLDVEEQKAHSIVWRNRGTLTKRLGNLLRQIDTDVAAVVEGNRTDDGNVTAKSKLPPAMTQPVQSREAI
jgi:hypothetical protein